MKVKKAYATIAIRKGMVIRMVFKDLEKTKIIIETTPIVRNGKQATVGYAPEIWKGWA